MLEWIETEVYHGIYCDIDFQIAVNSGSDTAGECRAPPRGDAGPECAEVSAFYFSV